MQKKLNAVIPLIIYMLFMNSSPALTAEKDLVSNAADYICAKAREGKKTRLAVYSFTNEAGDTSAEARTYSTKIMSIIIDTKEFKVIDPESVPELIKEQEKGLTGLVDPETAAETGKMIGADALVFGIAGAGSLQVRIIDAASGEVIGATLEENKGKTKINNEDFSSSEGKKRFMAAEFERNLKQIYNKNPMLYLYITANEKELKELNEAFPKAVDRLKTRIENRNNPGFDKRKKKLADFRNSNPDFDNRIRQSRKSLMESMKDKDFRKQKKKGRF